MMTSAQIRSQFLEFFRTRQHHIVPSAPIVIKDDPTLMFTNAGMNQFKDYFLGNRKAPYSRVADTQKCLRVSGKHNDLEEVGVDTYHHTMFEMLGNWSFGDPANPGAGYFKKEAIAWSWELLTDVLKIPKDRIYVTVFEGSEEENIGRDSEAVEEWKKWIAPDRILPFGKKDNFWEMGDTGPCGPCTEIHVDTRSDEEIKKKSGKYLVNADHPQVIEIWNNVFIQYNRVWGDKSSFDAWEKISGGSNKKEERAKKVQEFTKLEELPAKHVDTGMGFERLVRVIQSKQSNYDTDVFMGVIEKISDITGKPYKMSDSKSDIAIRVNADHLRAIAFTIADGQLPSNTGAGYVIRRILRRAVRYYYSYLDYQQPLLYQLISPLANQFADVFPDLKNQEAFVTRVIREEEEAFLRTLGKGITRFQNYLESASANGNKKKIISGAFAFELNDTYGFPVDLTELMARESGWTVDKKSYDEEMQKQKDRSRAATAIDKEDWISLSESNTNEFIGYDSLETTAKVLRYRKVKTKNKEAWQLVLDKTPFYAESGGQIGDTGIIMAGSSRIPIIDTRKENDLIIHIASEIPSHLEEVVTAKVDVVKRKHTAVHHTATHLLHAALRKVLGTHVAQKGSLVNADYLRFDFSHFSKMSEEEIRKVEEMVNEKIRENIPVVIRNMAKEEAMKTGAMALFGEKYGDTVRVVTIDPSYSIELCGGTHVGATGELGFFKITSESAIAAGVRRIEAVSGQAAENYINVQGDQLAKVREVLKNPPDLIKSIQTLSDENAALKKSMEKFSMQQLKTLSDSLAKKTREQNGYNFLGEIVEVSNADSLKKLAFDLKQKLLQPIIVLAAAIEGKAHVVLLFDEQVAQAKGLDAGSLIKQKIGPLIRGGGGGQKTLATAGGPETGALSQVIETVKSLL